MNLPLHFVTAAAGSLNLDLKHNSWGCLIYLFIDLPFRVRSELVKKVTGGLRHLGPGAFFNCFGCSLFQATGRNYMQIFKSVKGSGKFVPNLFPLTVSLPYFRQRWLIICSTITLSRVLVHNLSPFTFSAESGI
jgi:hypothetical protein